MCLPLCCHWLSLTKRLQTLRAQVAESSKMKFKRGKEIRPETIDYTYFNELDSSSTTNTFPRIKIVENTTTKGNECSTSEHTHKPSKKPLKDKNISTCENNNNYCSSIRILDSIKKEWITRARQNDTASMIELLKFYPELVTSVDPISGYTALHWAAKHGNIEMVRHLCQSNLIQIDKRSRSGYTALHLAQNFGRLDVSDFLTKDCNANISIRDNYGFKSHQCGKRKEHKSLLLHVLV